MASKKKSPGTGKKATAKVKSSTRSAQTISRTKTAKKKTASPKKAVKKTVANKKSATAAPKTVARKKAVTPGTKDKDKHKKSTAKKATVKKTTTMKKTESPSGQKASVSKKGKATAKKATTTHKAEINIKKNVPTPKAAPTPKEKTQVKPAPADHKSNDVKAVSKKPVPKKPTTKPKFVYKPEPSILDIPRENNTPRKRYSDAELQEFKDLIQRKLESARKELIYLQGLITRKDEAGTDDTENKYMGVEDGGGTMEREQLSQLASRQIQYIDHLEKALVRIENKTYGICRETGKLIDKARLRAVPHATLSIEAKLAKKR
jgi:RNA polymerase-binding transcription factor DksA